MTGAPNQSGQSTLAATESKPTKCPACRYDLRGIPEEPCPECGYVSTALERDGYAARRRLRLTLFALTVVTAPLMMLLWALIGWQAKSWIVLGDDADTWMIAPISFLLVTAGVGATVIFGAERMSRDSQIDGPRLSGAAGVCAGSIVFIVLVGWLLPFALLNSICLHCMLG